jgi:hypothetical protein
MSDLHARRSFLRAAATAGAAWAAADLVRVEEALAWALDQKRTPAPPAFTALTAAQAKTVEAVAYGSSRRQTAGRGHARAGVVHFIDRALATFNAAQKPLYVGGIEDLDRRGFGTLTADGQAEVLREIERTPFFQAIRFDTIVGMFALPTWGGNRGHAGWHMLGLEHQPQFQPPFGTYDADANASR